MKKAFLLVLVGAMALSLAACDRSSTEKGEESAEEGWEAEASEDGNAQTDGADVSSDKLSAEEDAAEEADVVVGSLESEETGAQGSEEGAASDRQEDETAAAETDDGEAMETAKAPDLSAATDASGTSETETVPFGAWTKTTLYATQDGTFHTAYVRVAKVTTQSEDPSYVASAIETNDTYGEAEDAFHESEFEVPEDGELVVLDYQVYVPEDFPAANYGMPEPRLYFSMRNIGGGGIPSTDGSETYVGLGTTQDLIVRDGESVYKPGNTYTERCIYAMVDGYTDYVATYSTYPEGTIGEEADVNTLYTVYHAVK